jgi:hypothetical protein
MHCGCLRAFAARRHHRRSRSAFAQKKDDLADELISRVFRRHRSEPIAKFAPAEK